MLLPGSTQAAGGVYQTLSGRVTCVSKCMKQDKMLENAFPGTQGIGCVTMAWTLALGMSGAELAIFVAVPGAQQPAAAAARC